MSDPNKYLDDILENLRSLQNDQPVAGESKTTIQDLDPLIHQEIQNSEQDRDLKKMYATRFMWILVVQLVVMNIMFFLVGCKLLTFGDLVLDIYITGTLAQVFGVVLVITKNLFPIKKDKL